MPSQSLWRPTTSSVRPRTTERPPHRGCSRGSRRGKRASSTLCLYLSCTRNDTMKTTETQAAAAPVVSLHARDKTTRQGHALLTDDQIRRPRAGLVAAGAGLHVDAGGAREGDQRERTHGARTWWVLCMGSKLEQCKHRMSRRVGCSTARASSSNLIRQRRWACRRSSRSRSAFWAAARRSRWMLAPCWIAEPSHQAHAWTTAAELKARSFSIHS